MIQLENLVVTKILGETFHPVGMIEERSTLLFGANYPSALVG
jgi:hypothetical protein